MKKIKISQLPLYNSLEGLSTIGTDADNRSVRVELSFIVQAFKDVVAEAKAAAEAAQSVADDTSAAISGKVDKVEGKGLSANDFTDAFKAKLEGLSNYDDAEVRSLIAAINGRLDTIIGDGASTAIDTFNEIEAFLTGITDTQTLTGLLAEQKQTITSETDTKLAGKVDKVTGKGLSTNDYTNADKTKLDALPTKTELDASLASKQPAITPSDDIAPLGSAKLALTTPAKYSAFDDVWVRLCGYNGGLDYSHTENNISKPYRLNGLWLTRNEAIDIVAQHRTWGTPTEDCVQRNIRTNIPIAYSSTRMYSNSFAEIEVANLDHCLPNVIEASFGGNNLTSIIKFNAQYLIRVTHQSFIAPNLVTLDISNLKISLDLSKCPLIDLTSWQGLVSRAANTDAITVTVHPDVYAKLTGDTTNAAASALAEAELAQWQALVAQAAEKQITFATT